jgi:hypothetical protein
LLFLLYGIAALDHGATEADPIEEIVVSLDFGCLGSDDPADFGVRNIAQEEECALDPTEFTKRAIKKAIPVV